jgi:hypothetical protein
MNVFREAAMFTLFQWGFVLAMGLTWLALGIGALLLLLPANARAKRPTAIVEEKRAA